MAKRRINRQQTTRIKKLQDSYRENETADNKDGLILSRFSRHAQVETEAGELIHCSIRPNIDSLVAGDRVVWQAEGIGQGVIVSRYPRDTVLGRSDNRGGSKPVAANISQLIIVVAAKPLLSWTLLDSYLVMAENLRLQPVIVLNKVDLDCDRIKQELLQNYQSLGYSVLFTCGKISTGLDELEKALNNNVSVFAGQSGVGKSSLIKAILPHEIQIQTAEISADSELGCHTTSNSRLYHLPKGGALIDSPGVREFGLWDMSARDIVYGFREIRTLISGCRFRNCNHIDSPDCLVIKSLDKGVSRKRYDSFIRMLKPD